MRTPHHDGERTATHVPAPHDDETVKRARELAGREGLAAAAAEVGVAKSTVSRWCNRAPKVVLPTSKHGAAVEATAANVRRWDERRLELKHRLGDVVELGVSKAVELLNEGRPRDARDAMTTAAIALDKAEVLSVHDDPEQGVADAEAIEAKVVAQRGRGLVLLPGGQPEERTA